ncbi:MAG TPA: tRNA (adenosine(37)-N6)-threonylcarbamoyltransferase complex dimerization subunit type 1 TsaB [Phycisphaerae bacterium]|nr:tRNA (adenosine(37)-N6)-threonylcarbamoyltransferase complex dimerization subunit type 1 TsaB [Phycisphaerae bacterium]
MSQGNLSRVLRAFLYLGFAGSGVGYNALTVTTGRRILVIETSSRVGAAALADESGLVASAQLPGLMRHAGELLPTIDHLMKAQGWQPDSITDVFVSIGPGSFTGLRVGVTVARTLAWSIGARIVAVPTADSLARNALAAEPVPHHLAVILDAKQSRVFAAAFELADGRYLKTVDAHLVGPGEFLSRCPRPLAVLGEGIPYHRPAVDEAGIQILPEELWQPRAESLYRIGIEMAKAGQYTAGGDLLPLYIRRPEAEEKWEKLHGPQGRQVR